MWKKIAIGIAALVAVLVLVIALRPPTFHIERSTVINAPPERVFAFVNDFHAWSAWSPWEKLDPNMKRSYDGPRAGVGAKYAWVGNDEVGEGRMTIEQSQPPSRVVVEIEFLKPMAATNTATFAFVKAGDTTKVTWAMDGNNNFVSKAFQLVMDMDALVGKDFERGLAQLKTASEIAPAAGAARAAE